MTDFLLKVFQALASPKAASKLVCGASISLLTLFTLYNPLAKEAKNIGLSTELVWPLLVLLGLGSGVLVAEGVIYSASRVKAYWLKRVNNLQLHQRHEEQTEKVLAILFRLPQDQVSVLAAGIATN